MSSIPLEVRRILEAQGITLPEDSGGSVAADVLAELGIRPPEPEGSDIFQPIRTTFGATGGVVPKALEPLAPGQYASARAALEKAHGITPTSPWYEKTEALPGLGDVAAEFVPESVRQSRLGTALGPIGRLAGNILGDPTTYTPAILGRATGAIARGVPEARTLIQSAAEAELARRSALAAAPLAEGMLGPSLTRGAAEAARLAEGRQIARTVLEQGAPLQREAFRVGSAIREAEPFATGAAAALAYGPAAARGALEGWKQVGEGITEQPILDTAAEATNAALQTGLSALMAKGLISAVQATATFERHLAEQRPARVEGAVAAVGEDLASRVRRLGQEPPLVEPPLAPLERRGPFAPPELGEPGIPRLPREPGFAPELPPPGMVEPIPSMLRAQPEGVPSLGIPRKIETAPQPRMAEGEIAPVAEVRPPGEAPSAQPAVARIPSPEPSAPPAPRIQEPTAREATTAPPKAPTVTREVRVRTEPEIVRERERAAALAEAPRAPELGPTGKVPVEGPAKPAAEGALERITPEFVDGLVKGADDRLAQDPEVGRVVKSVFGLGARKRVSPRDAEVQGALTVLLKDPERRAALVKKLDDVEKALVAEGKEMTPGAVRATVMKEARSGEALIGRKAGQEVVERAAAEAPAPVGKLEVQKKISNHYDFIKDQIQRQGSELQQAGVKSVGELVEQLPLAERFKPHEVQAYRDYVKSRDGGSTHAQALEFVRAQQKNRWSSNQAAGNVVNLILKQARELEQKRLARAGEVVERVPPTPDQAADLAREKQLIQGHIREGIRSGDKDELATALGAFLAHLKRRQVFDVKRIDLKELKTLARTLPEREGARKIPESAYKNAEALVEAIARHEGVVVKELKPRMEQKLAPVIQEARAQLRPERATTKKAAAQGALPGGPGGFEVMPTRPGVSGVRWKGRNGLVVSYIKEGGNVRIEKIPEGRELALLKEDFASLREDPDVKQIDLSEDVPLKALDGILSPEDGRLPAFIEDPDPPRGIDRLVRTDAAQDRFAEMEAAEVFGFPPSWAQPLRAADPEILREKWGGSAQRALDDKKGPLVGLKDELKRKGFGDLDLTTPAEKLGSGTYHSVYALPGTNLVLRVGKAAPFELSTPAQRALVQETLTKGKLGEHAGEPLFYTVHPKGIVGYDGTSTYQISAVDETGKLSAVLQALDPRLKVYARDPAAAMMLEGEMTGALPPGRSLQEYFDDVGTLLWKAANNDLDIAHDVMSHTNLMSTPWGMRGEQFAYFPVERVDTLGVGYVDPGGQAWQLRTVDAGVLTPWGSKMKEHPQLGQVHASNRIAFQTKQAESRLTLSEKMRQALHYDEDSRDAELIDEGIWSANHDRLATDSYVAKHGELAVGATRGLKGVVEDLVRRINDQYDVPAEGRLNVEYRGLTSSPYLAGLYHERQGAGVAEAAHIYTNVTEAVASTPSYDAAVDSMLHTVIHETVHNKSKGHGASFQTIEEYVKNLLQAQKQFDVYREKLKGAFSEADYQRIQSELVPEYSRMRRQHGYRTGSWRNGAVEGVPARAAEGGAAPISDRLGGGEEAAPRDLALGIEPRGNVPGGGPGPAGELRPPTTARGLAPEAPAQGEAARPAAGRDPLAEIKTRISEYGAKDVADEQAAKVLLHQMVDGSRRLGSTITNDQIHQWSWTLAGDLEKQLSPAERARRAVSLPSPTKPGQMKGPINMLHYIDLPEATKARIQIWGDLVEGMLPKEVQRWADVDKEVQDMIGLRTPEQWAYHFRNQGGGVSAKELLLMRQVSEELAQKVTRAELQLSDALARGASTEEITKLQTLVNQVNRSAVEGGLMMVGGGEKAGRALAILGKDIRKMNPQVAFEQDLLAGLRERTQTRFRGDKAKAEASARELFNKFMEIRNSSDPDWAEFGKAYRAMLGSRLWPDKILEFYKAGLLGWPSRVANMSSNALLRGVRMVEDSVAAGLDAIGSKLTGKERELYLGEASVSTLALRRAWGEAIPEWIQEMKRNVLLQPDDFSKSLVKGSMMEDLLQHGGAIEGKKGEFLRFHLKGMGADDALAKHFIRTDSMYRQIYRKVRTAEKGFEKVSGESAAQATERLFSDLRGNWKAAVEGAPQYDFAKLRTFEPIAKEAESTARRETFQEELGGTAKGGQTFLRNHPFLQIFIPFYRTPINITKETLARTPLGLFKIAKEWNTLTPAQKASQLSRPLTGTALGMGALAYSMAGGATGGGPLDPDERAMLESTGWQPYSVKIGNQYISFQRLEPIASILGVSADAAEGIRNGDFQSARTGSLRVMQSAAENITNKTFLSGLDALTSAISHPNQFMNSFIKRMQSSLIPNSLGYVPVSGLARALDQTYRQTDPMTMSAFYAKLPFLSSTLEPQYSPSGEERRRPGTALEQIVSPFARVKLEGGPARVGAEEVVRLSASPKAPRRYWVAPGGLRVDFKPEERQAMAQSMQEATKYIGERLIKDPNYLSLPDNELDSRFRFGAKTKEVVIKNVYGRYRDRVMQRIKPQLAARAKKTLRERA